MVDRKIIELMHKEIEGVISNTEKARLDQYVLNNSSVQKIYQELQVIIKPLNSISDLDPPSNLKKNVMNAIDPIPYTKVNIRKTKQWSVARWLSPSNPKLAYAFALGLIFGFIITALWLQDKIQKTGDMKDYYGTIRMSDEKGLRKIKESTINFPQANGAVSINRLDQYLLIDINLNTSAKFKFILEYNDTELRFTHFMPLGKDKNILESKNKSIVVSGSERGAFRLTFSEISDIIAPIKYKLYVSGELLSSQHLVY